MKRWISALLALCVIFSLEAMLSSCTIDDLEGFAGLGGSEDLDASGGSEASDELASAQVYRNGESSFVESFFVLGENEFSYIRVYEDNTATSLLGHYEIKETELGVRIFCLLERTCVRGHLSEISTPYYIEDPEEPERGLFYEIGEGYVQIDETVYTLIGGIEVLPDEDGNGIPDYIEGKPSDDNNAADDAWGDLDEPDQGWGDNSSDDYPGWDLIE